MNSLKYTYIGKFFPLLTLHYIRQINNKVAIKQPRFFLKDKPFTFKNNKILYYGKYLKNYYLFQYKKLQFPKQRIMHLLITKFNRKKMFIYCLQADSFGCGNFLTYACINGNFLIAQYLMEKYPRTIEHDTIITPANVECTKLLMDHGYRGLNPKKYSFFRSLIVMLFIEEKFDSLDYIAERLKISVYKHILEGYILSSFQREFCKQKIELFEKLQL